MKKDETVKTIKTIRTDKRAQTTVFIIIAILLVFAIISVFLIKPDLINIKELTMNQEVKPLYSFVQSCIEQTAENAIQHIGENGGYYISPNNSLFNGIPIYFDKGDAYTLTTEQIELELSKYMEEMLFFCTKNFIDFTDFQASQSKIKTTTSIKKGKVNFDIEYPLSISKQGKTYTFKKFNAEIPVRLLTVNNAVNQIIQDQKEFPQDICITCIEQVAMENQLIIDMRDFQDSVIFSISDLDSEINQKEFVFYFANKY